MYRLLIVLILLIVLFFLLRSALRELRRKPEERALGRNPNQMIQDPVCRLYVPKGSAVSANMGGQTYYFCSTECAKAFQKQLSG